MKRGAGYIGAPSILITFTRISQAGGIGGPEAVARLTEERSRAEICVAALKRNGHEDQVSRGRLTYSAATADFDGRITGLITALSQGGDPGSLPTFEANVESGASALKAFCKTAEDLVSAKPGQKGVLVDMLKAAVE